MYFSKASDEANPLFWGEPVMTYETESEASSAFPVTILLKIFSSPENDLKHATIIATMIKADQILLKAIRSFKFEVIYFRREVER